MDISQTICDAARLARGAVLRLPEITEELIQRYGGDDPMVMVELVTISSAVSLLLARHNIIVAGLAENGSESRRRNARLQADLADLMPGLADVVGDLNGSICWALVSSIGAAMWRGTHLDVVGHA